MEFVGGSIHEGKALVSSGKVPYDPASWVYRRPSPCFLTGPMCPWEPSMGPSHPVITLKLD